MFFGIVHKMCIFYEKKRGNREVFVSAIDFTNRYCYNATGNQEEKNKPVETGCVQAVRRGK